MSSKKKLRQKRREKRATERRPQRNPATVFILVTAGVLLLVVLFATLRGPDRIPPRPGAVWSEEHGHWH